MCARTRSRSVLMSLMNLLSCGVVSLAGDLLDALSGRCMVNLRFVDGRSASAQQAHHERHRSDDDEDEKQDLGNFRGAGRDSAEAEYRGDQRDDEENDGVVEHGTSLCGAD